MLGLPNEPLPGQALKASDHAAMVRYVRQITPRSSPGGLVLAGSGGTTRRPIVQRQPYQWPLGSASPFPYQGSNASDGTAPKVKVRFGTHNNVSPQIGGVDLIPPLGTPVPALTLSPEDTIVYVEFDFSFNAIQQITAYSGRKVLSGGSAPLISALTIADDGSGTGIFYQTLFGVIITEPVGAGAYGVAISQNLDYSPTFFLCSGQIIEN